MQRAWIWLIIALPMIVVIGFFTLMLTDPGQREARRAPTRTSGEALIGGPFTLVDQTGQTVTDVDFHGRAMLIYFGCLAILPIGIVVAGLFTSPIFVLLIAVIFQGKRVGWLRSLAIVTGFAGALLVIRPDPAALDLVVFLPILAGLLYAIGAIATRAWCEGETTLTLSAGFFAMLAVFGAVGCLLLPSTGTGADGFAQRGWMPVTDDLVFWIAVQAALALVGIFCLFRGYQLGEASQVAVYEYSLLIFASGWAWYLWGDLVSPVAMAGMALIALAGIIIVSRRSV